jgi:hypothetical protein
MFEKLRRWIKKKRLKKKVKNENNDDENGNDYELSFENIILMMEKW